MTDPLRPIVVMGVSAVGKTTIGIELARLTGARFVDADDLHGEANVTKMSAGIPLEDADRWPWLDRVGAALEPGTVVACSALKRAYRDVLRRHAPEAFFVHLHVDAAELMERAAERDGHFMPAALLQSQLDSLEPLSQDEAGATIDADARPEEVAARALASLPTGDR
ncbi:gluconokinase [Microbacterium sp.]|uniref:gluconokinase n=1 Tax=Microbacterium sp. TaxID=51671 RepID=UPI002812031E|nr:gluconokinase [Microbacterium sp.]